LVAEGARVEPGTPVIEIEGLAVAVLAGERTALDFLMLLSGIATETASWVEAAQGRLLVCDTRKTQPGLRDLSKYAVQVGGGTNHRHGLWDMVLVKDNHIEAAGGIRAAVEAARSAHPALPIEVEADTLAQVHEAAEAGADIVLLDNMADDKLSAAIASVHDIAARTGRVVLTEASGGIKRERMAALIESGVDRVSTSALTMGVRPIDFGLDEG
jgi:nicotinate-nucleotide pyrophosphorylase (carboxylating)